MNHLIAQFWAVEKASRWKLKRPRSSICTLCNNYTKNWFLLANYIFTTGLFIPNTLNCRLCMRRECRERFPRHRLQRQPLVSDPAMHHGTCATHVPGCMSGSLTCVGGENVPGIPAACATHNFTYLSRGPCTIEWEESLRLEFSWSFIFVDEKMSSYYPIMGCVTN